MLTCSEMKKSHPVLFNLNVFFNGAPTEICTKSIELGRSFGFSLESHSKFLSPLTCTCRRATYVSYVSPSSLDERLLPGCLRNVKESILLRTWL